MPLLARFAPPAAATPYDRFVAVMRVALPLAAIVVGAGAMLWPLLNDGEASFTLSREDLVQRDDTVRVIGARYAGRDRAGKRFEVRADEALQNEPDDERILIEGLEARMNLNADNAAYVRAERGVYRFDTQALEAADGVRLVTTDGYRVETAGATVDLGNRTARSAGPVTGTSRLGRFQAARADLSVDERVLRLTGGVTMHIAPDGPARSSESEGKTP